MKIVKNATLTMLVILSLFLSILLGITVFLTYLIGDNYEEEECYFIAQKDAKDSSSGKGSI